MRHVFFPDRKVHDLSCPATTVLSVPVLAEPFKIEVGLGQGIG
jgi:hypothetical protein